MCKDGIGGVQRWRRGCAKMAYPIYIKYMIYFNSSSYNNYEFSYKEEHATQLRHAKKLFVSVNESTNDSHLNQLKTDNQTNIPIKDKNA